MICLFHGIDIPKEIFTLEALVEFSYFSLVQIIKIFIYLWLGSCGSSRLCLAIQLWLDRRDERLVEDHLYKNII